MAKPHQRVFALILAALFLITSLASGVAVVWQIRQEGKESKTAPQETANTETVPAPACATSAVDSQITLPAPEAFKPEGDVTSLQVTDLEAGTGEPVKAGDCLVTKYYGTVAATGTKFDENFTMPKALKLTIGKGSVIKGWDEGLVGMKPGGTRRLVIPANLAYGEEESEAIPANSDLVFVVKLLSIEKL